MTNVFTIKDLERLSGVKAHTIRIWEQRYNFLKPGRTETNIRYYTHQELKTVLNISLLNKYGYKISHISKMSMEEVKTRLFSLTDPDAKQERLVNELIACMVDLDMESFERAIDTYILTEGIDKAIARVVFPFLHRTGILWEANHINPVQEHLVTNIIRQRLIVGIEESMAHRHTGKTILLYLPEGEHRELGLLYVYYLLKTHGVNVLCLGADISSKDVEFLCLHKKPDKILPVVNFRRAVGEAMDFIASL